MALSPETNDSGATETEHVETPTAASPVVLHDRYVIQPDAPDRTLDSPMARAYEARDKQDSRRRLFALIGAPDLPVRGEALDVLLTSPIRGVLPLVEAGPVYWPPQQRRCMAIIYERPLGGRVGDFFNIDPRINLERMLPRRVMTPVFSAIQQFKTYRITHRAIRVDNLFFMDEEKTSVVLGDCVLGPPGHHQPTVYETIERGMCSPAGRGDGEDTEDLYALGVTLVQLALGRAPDVAYESDRDMLMAKIWQGSYAALCGRARVPMSLIEPLRGLLSDDPEERWDLEQLENWLGGKRMTPIQRRAAPKAESAMMFDGEPHFTPRTLAYALSRNVDEAAAIIRSGQLETWLRRSLNDVIVAEGVAAALALARAREGNSRGKNDALVSHICMWLDPTGPIRYKGYSFMPEGFGMLLAAEFLREGNLQVMAEVISRDLVSQYFTSQDGFHKQRAEYTRSFAILRELLSINQPGYGLERCLYELNPKLPCQSPHVVRAYVEDVRELLPALDAAAKTVDPQSRPIDRHIAAFIATRFKHRDLDRKITVLASTDRSEEILGMLNLLALMQYILVPTQPLIGLAGWLAGLLSPVITNYHNRKIRRELERRVPQLVKQGSLSELGELIDNPAQWEEDQRGFREAVARFSHAEAEIGQIERNEASNSTLLEQVGQQMAAMGAIVISMIVVCVVFLFEIM